MKTNLIKTDVIKTDLENTKPPQEESQAQIQARTPAHAEAHTEAHTEAYTEDKPVRAQRPQPTDSRSWLWLAIGAVLLLFANGVDNVALAAWLAPVFLLRFVRTQSFKVWLPVTYVLAGLAGAFEFRGMVPIHGTAYYIFLALYGIPALLPYVLDRLLAPRLGVLAATLVFPTACAALDYLSSQGAYGSWGAAAYSEYGNLPLLQLLSVTGMWGISFLMAWFATVCNGLWEEGMASQKARRVAWLCGATIAAVILAGGARLVLFPPSSQSVRVASLSKRTVGPELDDAVAHRMFSGTATSEDLVAVKNWANPVNDDLLVRADREMQAGAKIVFWGEANAILIKDDEAAFVARGEDLAQKYHAYLGMALGVLTMGKKQPIENKLVLIEPNGQVAWEYNKAHPVPGIEAAHQVPGDGKLRDLDTPYGRLSSIICFDGDFPQLLSQAGALGTDVMIDPSNDWRAIDPWHTQMASFRAIEQGFNLIRQTSRGLSAAYDYQGRRLSAMDHYQTSDYVMVSDVPTRGVRTIYSRFGDWFAWLCLAGLALLTIQALRQKRAA
jgi:apolipoprotein N-acyltransferase